MTEAAFDPRAFIAKAPWRYAKTLSHIPHEYTVRGQTPDEEFEWFVTYIKEHGYVEKFNGSKYCYLNVGEWRYWSMGWSLKVTRIINRAPVSQPRSAKAIAAANEMPPQVLDEAAEDRDGYLAEWRGQLAQRIDSADQATTPGAERPASG